MRMGLVCLVVIVSLSGAHADDQTRSVQEELRRRHVYFGEIDGQQSQELSEAIKHYQTRKGFTASGQADTDTERSLGLLPRQPGEAPPKELEWPAEPVLKSDFKINPKEEVAAIAEETGVSEESLTPPAARSNARENMGSHRRVARTFAPSEIRRPRAAMKVDPQELRAFVARYLKAASRNDLPNELCFYADHVNYFRNGVTDRRIVERTLRAYYQRWGTHRYELGKLVAYRPSPRRGEIQVIFRVAFVLKNGRNTVKGQTDDSFIINAATDDPRITSVDERRVRS